MSEEKPLARTEFPTGDLLAFERTRLAYEGTMSPADHRSFFGNLYHLNVTPVKRKK